MIPDQGGNLALLAYLLIVFGVTAHVWTWRKPLRAAGYRCGHALGWFIGGAAIFCVKLVYAFLADWDARQRRKPKHLA